MARPQEITDRDIKLFSILARCRILHIDQVAKIYGVAHYHIKRVSVLEERGYLLRKGSYIENSLKAFREVAPDMARPPAIRSSWKREQAALCAEVFLTLNKDWDFMFALEYKRQEIDVNRGARFEAVLTHNGQRYVLYVTSARPTENTLKVIKREIKDANRLGIYRIIVLYQTKNGKSTVPAQFPLASYGVDSLMVLPLEKGIEILNRQNDIFNLVHSTIPSAKVSERTFVDLEYGQSFVSIFTNNDVARMHQLREYMRIAQAKEAKQVQVLCLRSQFPVVSRLFPTLKILTIADHEVFDKAANA